MVEKDKTFQPDLYIKRNEIEMEKEEALDLANYCLSCKTKSCRKRMPSW